MDKLLKGDDFDAFIEAPPTKLAHGSTAISWWSAGDQIAAYPTLSKLAIDVLSALVMSAHTERTFSRTRRTTSWERSRLSDETIERTECTKDWESSGLAYDEPLEELPSIEDDESIADSIEETTTPPPSS